MVCRGQRTPRRLAPMVANSVMAALMIGIIVFSVLVVAVRYALKFFRVSNTSLKATVRSMDQRVARLRAMSASCKNGELSDFAMRVADGLRFGDSSIVLPLDGEIDDAIEGRIKRYAYMTFRQPKGSSIRLRALLNNVERKRLSAERGRSDSERRKKGKMHGTGES